MNKKRLRVVVPAVQVLLLISAVIWHKIAWQYNAQPDIALRYANIPQDVLVKLNFPLLILWGPILLVLEWAFSANYLSLPNGAALVVISVVLALVILSSVALFWYFVVVEVESRSQGSSLIRSSNRKLETLKAVVLVGAGVGSAVYAYWDGRRLLSFGRSIEEITIGGLFLVIWAIVLIKISIRDLVIAVGKR